MSDALRELFSSGIGLLSLFTIAFIIVMAFYIYCYVKQQIQEEEKSGSTAASSGQQKHRLS